MAIEIKELYVRLSVSTAAPGSGGAQRPVGAAGAPNQEMDALIAACVDQVMQLLRDKAERYMVTQPSGKLEKMLILAFETSQDAETGGRPEAKESFEVLINPETYTLGYKVKTADGQGQGTSGAQAKFEYTMPEELSFEFLFDNTGLIDGKAKPEGIFDDVNHLRKMLIEYQGASHEPYHLKLVWGNLIFKGRATELAITYRLFNPDGQPIRAVAKATFKGSIEEKKRVAKDNSQSPDVTHIRLVKGGGTLPLMCYEVYRDPSQYLMVAAHNRLTDFRALTPGTELFFPPLEEQARPQ